MKMTKSELLTAIAEHLPQYNGQVFNNNTAAEEYFVMRLALEEREHLDIAFLNGQHQLIETVRMFSGTVDASAVYPREIVKKALELNAAAVIISHNHPSGALYPSEADKKITERIKDALGLIDIRLLDHIIVAGTGTYSFAQRGQL